MRFPTIFVTTHSLDVTFLLNQRYLQGYFDAPSPYCATCPCSVMSVNRSNSPSMVGPEDYQTRKAQIAAMKAHLDQMEEKIDQKKQNYEAFMQQLEDKVRQGDEAK